MIEHTPALFERVPRALFGPARTVGSAADPVPSVPAARSLHDTAVAASSSGSTSAYYQTRALTANEFTVGSGNFTGPATTTVRNDDSGIDFFGIYRAGSTIGIANGVYDLYSLGLYDSTATTLTSAALPSSLGLFGSAVLSFQYHRRMVSGVTMPATSATYPTE